MAKLIGFLILSMVLAVACVATAIAWDEFMVPVFKVAPITPLQALAAIWLTFFGVFLTNNVFRIYIGPQDRAPSKAGGKHG